eukprot:2121700-Rhodomonas_salina.4
MRGNGARRGKAGVGQDQVGESGRSEGRFERGVTRALRCAGASLRQRRRARRPTRSSPSSWPSRCKTWRVIGRKCASVCGGDDGVSRWTDHGRGRTHRGAGEGEGVAGFQTRRSRSAAVCHPFVLCPGAKQTRSRPCCFRRQGEKDVARMIEQHQAFETEIADLHKECVQPTLPPEPLNP